MDGEIKIRSEQFYNVKITGNDILTWLKLIRELSGEADLQMTLDLCATYKKTPEEKNALVIIKVLLTHEASGNITPPINLSATFKNLEAGIAINDRRSGKDRRSGQDRRNDGQLCTRA